MEPSAAPRPSREPLRIRVVLWTATCRALLFARSFISNVAYLALGGFLTLLIIAVVALDRREDLSIWHTVVLEEEFDADCGDRSFTEYLAREDRLFTELESEIYAHTGASEHGFIDRYRKGSPADPTSHPVNWNRSFELRPDGGGTRCGVLLLHGMSDSPYSFRSIGLRLQKEGVHVIALRLPGHGTVPSGLLEVTWKDFDASVRLAVKHLHEQLPEQPVYIAGYSNGGALAVHYALEAAEDGSLPPVDGIILLSPAIGVSPMAGLAVWQARLGHWLGLEKLAWNSISPEYDPFKYNSFAVNAGDQVYRITAEIAGKLGRLGPAGKLDDFPPVLAFQSAVDATVSTPKLIEGLFSRLPGDRNELVLFDVNRSGHIENFLSRDPRETLRQLVVSSAKPFHLTVLANRTPDRHDIEERRYSLRDSRVEIADPGLRWPPGVYSLSHVALPFPPDDPIYGNGLSPEVAGSAFQIGNVALRGERGVLQVSATEQLRLRWNPFHAWLEQRVVDFVKWR